MAIELGGEITRHQQRFRSNIDGYARYRPSYPDGIIDRLVSRIVAIPATSGQPVLDVGSGTGIFTRQLAGRLPPDIPLIGIEPGAEMRQAAIAGGETRAVYRDGTAECLPLPDGSARAVVAATAAHWFDRPPFYREAHRALLPGGMLAIVEYVRDEANSPAPRAVADFLTRHGEPRAYARPDYPAELGALDGFTAVVETYEPVTLALTTADFIGLALSSSHARSVVANLGQAAAETALADIGADLAGCDGLIRYGYLFQLFLVTRESLS